MFFHVKDILIEALQKYFFSLQEYERMPLHALLRVQTRKRKLMNSAKFS